MSASISLTVHGSRVLRRWLLTAGLTAVALGGLAAGPDQAWAQAVPGARRAAQDRYEQGVREAEAARRAYEADLAVYQQRRERHEQEVARAGEVRANYERRLAAREAGSAAPRAAPATVAPALATAPGCEQRVERNRSRGRLVGGLLGGIAGAVVGRRSNASAWVGALVPAGALLGDAIAGLLDCREQQQAATATEQAVSGGVGTTTSWTSATRPGVSGSSTVTAAADGGDCLNVTDVVIVDGEETRAPKRLCRRPPANRYVRV